MALGFSLVIGGLFLIWLSGGAWYRVLVGVWIAIWGGNIARRVAKGEAAK